MPERMIQANGVEICTESFGDAKHACILLIMGASASMVWWDDQFCSKIADCGRFVIRYDNRDVGRSTCYDPGEPPYSVLDIAGDALAVLDSYSIDRAHLVGMSLGGMISQIIAIRNPERVLSVTAIASSVWDDIPELPGPDARFFEYHAGVASLDWSDRESVIRFMVGGWKLLNGSAHAFDEERAYNLARTEVARARNLRSMFNHALLKGAEDLYGRSGEIRAPFLIIHGTQDPILPFVHAEALHKTIAGSKLIALNGSGHEIHREEWDMVIRAIVDHTGVLRPEARQK